MRVGFKFVLTITMQQTGNIHYSEQMSVRHLAMDAFLLVAYRAATPLKWLVKAIEHNAIVYKSGISTITLRVTGETADISVEQPHDYYHNTDTTRDLAGQLASVINLQIDRQEAISRSQLPAKRENWGALLLSETYRVTPVLVYLNVAVFVLMVLAGASPIQPKASTLLAWGGNYLPAVQHGQTWRLITYMFLHGGAAHLLGNLFGLLYAGMHLEPLIGKLRLGAAYIITGICAGLVSLALHDNSVGVGASGAIFGLYGVFLALLTTGYIEKTVRTNLLRVLLLFVVYNLGMGMQGNTDNAAHVGGLLSGLAIGYLFYPGIKKKASINGQLILMVVFAAVVAVAGYFLLPFFG